MHSSRPLRIGLTSSSGDQPELIPIKKWFPLLGMTVDKYVKCYAHTMPEIRDYNFKISYRNVEYSNQIHKIKHPFVRECLLSNYPAIKSLNISCLSSLPSGLGMGSSGSFAVAFTDLIARLEKDQKLSSYDLFISAYNSEKRISNEIGFQDHLHAAYGGFNLYEIKFNSESDVKFFRPEVRIRPLRLNKTSENKINESFALLYIPSNTIKGRNGKVGINIRKEMWDEKQLDEKYEKLTQIINLMESKEINFEKVGCLITNDAKNTKFSNGFSEVSKTLSKLKSKELIFGGRPLGSIGSKFALVVSNKKNFLELRDNGYTIINFNMDIKN